MQSSLSVETSPAARSAAPGAGLRAARRAAARAPSSTSDDATGEGPLDKPARTCIGCGEPVSIGTSTRTGAPGEVVRIVVGPVTIDAEGQVREIAIDASGRGAGRGAHLHPRPACVAGAVRGGLARSVKSRVTLEGEKVTQASLAAAIGGVYDRRTEGLIGAAKRAGRLAVGSDAVVGAYRRGDVNLVVVACDAASAASLGVVREAISAGRAASWATKALLARAAMSGDRPEGVAVVAITDDRIAGAVAHAVSVVDSMRAGAGSNEGKASVGEKPRGRRSQAVE